MKYLTVLQLLFKRNQWQQLVRYLKINFSVYDILVIQEHITLVTVSFD